MKLLKTFSASLLLIACEVKAPDAVWCVANPAGGRLTCYNLRKDYDYSDKGMRLKASAKATHADFNYIYDVEGWVCQPPRDFGKSKSWLEKLISRTRE